MKKKTNLLLIFLLCLSVTSCKQQPEQIVIYEKVQKTFEVESPSYKMDSVLKDIKNSLSNNNLDSLPLDSSIRSVIDECPADIVNEIIKMISSFDYQIIGHDIDGNKAIVKTTFTSYDFVPTVKKTIVGITKDLLVSSIMNSNKSMEDVIIDNVIESLDKLKEKGKEKSITGEFVFVLNDDEWEFDINSNALQLLDGISGGLMSSIGEIEELIEKIS